MLRTSLAGSIIGSVLLVGCGSAPPPEEKVPVHPASGTLTIANKAAKGATIIFVPKNEPADSKVPRPRATVEDDGSFKVRTFSDNDGGPAGDYGLIIIWPGNEQDDQLLGRYSSPEKTAVTVKIAAGNNELPPIKLR